MHIRRPSRRWSQSRGYRTVSGSGMRRRPRMRKGGLGKVYRFEVDFVQAIAEESIRLIDREEHLRSRRPMLT